MDGATIGGATVSVATGTGVDGTAASVGTAVASCTMSVGAGATVGGKVLEGMAVKDNTAATVPLIALFSDSPCPAKSAKPTKPSPASARITITMMPTHGRLRPDSRLNSGRSTGCWGGVSGIEKMNIRRVKDEL